jgi:hypothetical protein
MARNIVGIAFRNLSYQQKSRSLNGRKSDMRRAIRAIGRAAEEAGKNPTEAMRLHALSVIRMAREFL